MQNEQNNKQMENLRNLLNQEMERINSNVWAVWVDQWNYQGQHNVQSYLEDGYMMELYEPLMNAERNGLISLVIDDYALIVNIL